jgi:hypothetical protein
MDLELRGKSVLITGVSKGIGLACAHGFAAEGANVHLAARNTAAMEAAAEEISRKYKVEATVHTVDLGVTGSAVALGQKCGHVDVLVKARPSGKVIRRPQSLEGHPCKGLRNAAFQAHRSPGGSFGPRLPSRVSARVLHQRGGIYDRRRRVYTSACVTGSREDQLEELGIVKKGIADQ